MGGGQTIFDLRDVFNEKLRSVVRSWLSVGYTRPVPLTEQVKTTVAALDKALGLGDASTRAPLLARRDWLAAKLEAFGSVAGARASYDHPEPSGPAAEAALARLREANAAKQEAQQAFDSATRETVAAARAELDLASVDMREAWEALAALKASIAVPTPA